MALKEIKNRISSVRSTQKITSAMKMVSSAKLRKAQRAIEGAYPYEQKLSAMLSNFAGSADEKMQIPLLSKRDVKRVAVVVFSSNSSLCGSFNTNIAKQLVTVLNSYSNISKENISIFSIGKKVGKFCKKIGYTPVSEDNEIADKPDYEQAAALANRLVESFLNNEFDEAILIYHHFKNKAVQVVTTRKFLPLEIKQEQKKEQKHAFSADYIIEPNLQKVVEQLVPYVLRTEIYTTLLDSLASEHAARTLAMQTATDNADDLLQELSLQYNKQRQQAITSELLDIIGGSMA